MWFFTVTGIVVWGILGTLATAYMLGIVSIDAHVEVDPMLRDTKKDNEKS